MNRSAALPLLALFVAACQASVPDRPTEAPAPPLAAPYEVPPENEAGPTEGRGGQHAPRVRLEEVQGADPARTRASFAVLGRPLQECMAATSGVIRVRIERRGERVEMSVAPGTTLGPNERRCILETLSTLNYENLPPRGIPSDVPATGFTALLRIEW